MTYSLAIVVPCFNHAKTLQTLFDALQPLHATVYLVDDGSNLENQQKIDETVPAYPFVRLLRRKTNGGKGAAVIDGVRAAWRDGHSHVLQIDADGQHNVADSQIMIDISQRYPDRLISGRPVYDQSVPKSRLIGRYISHFWVWVETLSTTIADSMCGFRIYPTAPFIRLIDRVRLGQYMDFDPEILVRLYWEGVPMSFVPTQVSYPKDGLSNFDAVADNWRITKMHTRLFFASLAHWPALIRRKKSKHWSKIEERQGLLGMQFLLAIYKAFGRRAFRWMTLPALTVFWLIGGEQRRSSEEFLRRVAKQTDERGLPVLNKRLNSFAHFRHFSESILDKFASWMGDIHLGKNAFYEDDETQRIFQQKPGSPGKVIFVSHLGTAEVCRAIGEQDSGIVVNALVFEKNAPRFKSVLEKIAPNARLHLLAVDQVGIETAALLSERISRGEWVAIAADRTPVRPDGVIDRCVRVPFLGEPAPFPIGPYILASLLNSEVCVLFANRNRDRISIKALPFADRITLPRNKREEELKRMASKFASMLQTRVLQYPLDWFNFYDFWAQTSSDKEGHHE